MKKSWQRILVLLIVAFGSPAALGAGCGEGAPSIPHSISSQDDGYCLGCHRDGKSGAPQTPHPSRTGCTGCHTP